MKILYLGYFSTDETFLKLEQAGLDPSVGRQKLEKAMIDELLNGNIVNPGDVEIISYLPKNDKICFSLEGENYHGSYIHYVWTERNNIKHILHASDKINGLVSKWIESTWKEERIVLTYAANPVLLFSLKLKKYALKIVTICSEVPEFRNMTEGNPVINSLKKRVFSYFNKKMDGYIFLSKHMNSVCNRKNKPWIVIEGIPSIQPYISKKYYTNSTPVLFYAGGLHIENGIAVLLEAMKMLNEVELQLCGVGNAVETINKYVTENENIYYLGSLPNDRVMKLERTADLLINPRKPDHMLTRYSFPSKTFEYFTSGTPCIITKLDGIPDEYYKHCYTCDVSTPETLARDIRYVLNIPQKERAQKARDAYNFIKCEKSAEVQTKKIVDFLYKVARGQ